MQQLGSIYIIENDVNDKVYIGQTTKSIENRFSEHLKAALNRTKTDKFHCDILRIGKEHFRIRELERCSVDQLDSREKYYIKLYNAWENGYNSNTGGGGTSSLMHSEDKVKAFIQACNTCNNYLEVAIKTGMNQKTVERLARKIGIYSKDKTCNTVDYKMGIVILYDRTFKPQRAFRTLGEALRFVGVKHIDKRQLNSAFYMCSLYKGYRWQLLDTLTCIMGNNKYTMNSLIDKKYILNNQEAMVETDRYGLSRVVGLVYADYIGESARENCSVCGSILGKDNECKMCKSKAQMADKNIKINNIRKLAGCGKSLSEIGRIMGMSANGVKKICKTHGIEYSTSYKIELYEFSNDCGSTLMSLDEAYKMFMSSGMDMPDRYNFRAYIKLRALEGKPAYGYNVKLVK